MTRFERTIALTEAERLSVSAVPFTVEALKASERLRWAGDRPSLSFVILEGLLSTSKTTGAGEVQITAFYIPGDMPGLQRLQLDVPDYDLRALTTCTLAVMTHHDLRSLCERHPRLAAVLWEAALVEGEIYREWVVNIGRRPALNRVAHLLCEMMTRMEAVGLAHDGRCTLGLTQQDVSGAMGLSRIHVNRTLQDLRAEGLITFGFGDLIIHDRDRLAELGDFHADYLHLPLKEAA